MIKRFLTLKKFISLFLVVALLSISTLSSVYAVKPTFNNTNLKKSINDNRVYTTIENVPIDKQKVENGSMTAEYAQKKDTSVEESGNIKPQGLKGKALKLSVKRIAGMLRSSAIDKIAEWMETYINKEAAKYLRKYSIKIANKLDELSTWEDLALQAMMTFKL
ncbi:hypothetical protein BFT35_06715 [Thermoanaerobacterium thermosaccharolyticum]|uniref:hypothetical protein n=1 Tax=Thermoanaerobacterium thermosaccharolyticum TaxID=1517 RepID=UPI000C07258C|nr:hypothetical protein [Thermoanaerobacterium thermosaccharolyticum]PHO07302.1 hypothetical protein BFT35_06715 [Thermoanaerobacterium thermosaccharolyticum]